MNDTAAFLSIAQNALAAERIYICDLLAVTQGRVAEAARIASCGRVQFWRKIKKHGINPQEYEPKLERASAVNTWLQGVATA